MTEEPPGRSTQITLKVPTDFLKDFDSISGQLGYPRNEAVREAMRRFLDWSYQKMNERHPERAMGLAQGMISSLFGGIIEESKKLESTGSLSQKQVETKTSQSIQTVARAT